MSPPCTCQVNFAVLPAKGDVERTGSFWQDRPVKVALVGDGQYAVLDRRAISKVPVVPCFHSTGLISPETTSTSTGWLMPVFFTDTIAYSGGKLFGRSQT